MSSPNLQRVLSTVVAVAVLLALASPSMAQNKDKGPAFTEPPEDDPNFELMGEFVGPIEAGENEYQPLGIQVRSVGGDHFEARSFIGGLPGQSGFQGDANELVGRRAGDLVVLSGEQYAIFVEQDHCVIISREGNRLGRLERIDRKSPTLGAQPPEGALVLFDGSGTKQFTKAEMTDDGLLMQGADVAPMFQDFNLHLEFKVPYMPQAQGQARGNSGVYLQSSYECQILDSFALDPVYNGLGALYRLKKPALNMAFPPLVWQTYDIKFTAPRWSADGSKRSNATVTSWINGVKVQDNVELPTKTGAGKPEEPLLRPIRLQDHGDPIRFRNVWIVDRGLLQMEEFPLTSSDSPSQEEQGEGETGVNGDPQSDSESEGEKVRVTSKTKLSQRRMINRQPRRSLPSKPIPISIANEPERHRHPLLAGRVTCRRFRKS